MAGRKIGVGFNSPRVIDGAMTGYDVMNSYGLMRRISRSGIGQRKAFRWQRCKSMVETLREYREDSRSKPKRNR